MNYIYLTSRDYNKLLINVDKIEMLESSHKFGSTKIYLTGKQNFIEVLEPLKEVLNYIKLKEESKWLNKLNTYWHYHKS